MKTGTLWALPGFFAECSPEKTNVTPTIPILETRRLLLRPLCLADAPAVQEEFPRWEIVKLLSSVVPWPYPDDGALSFIRDIAIPAMARGTAWHWSIRPTEVPDRLIGVIGLMDGPDDNRGFWLAPQWQGRGLATEAAIAVTDYWFEILERPVLRVPKAIANTPSRRISQSSGMRVVASGERDYVSGRLPAEIWEITREEWRARPR
jgi:[ribosomal protein S5]-alanine N-acetyltransferase